MMKNNSIEEIAEKIFMLDRILLITHVSPDVDGLGAMLALAEALEKKGKQVCCFCADEIPRRFVFLEKISRVKCSVSVGSYDSIVVLDCGDINRTGMRGRVENFFGPVMNLDHHPQRRPFGSFCYVNTDKSSTCEIVYDIFKKKNLLLDKSLASLLLSGIVYDTNSFQIENTTPELLEVASELMRKGARLPVITREIFRVRRVIALKLWGRVLARIKIDPNTKMAFSVVTREDFARVGATPEDLAGLIDVINSASESKFSLLLSEDGQNIIKGSLRSESFKNIDVSKIAEGFGGGGHKFASGFSIEGKLENKNGEWRIA
ncbi:MAG: Phosphoesterase RecJ protein [uncultured bacterium]|nr:MAG: Phosphoesterase RecJ protein [uncultured bacterium]